jgi:hypothetical protein
MYKIPEFGYIHGKLPQKVEEQNAPDDCHCPENPWSIGCLMNSYIDKSGSCEKDMCEIFDKRWWYHKKHCNVICLYGYKNENEK